MKLLVLGAAVSGRAAARLGRRLGHDVTIYDADEAAVAEPAAHGYSVRAGEWDSSVLDGVDRVVTSPGISPEAAPIQDALHVDVTVWSEMEFAARHLGVPYLAVTGTNGKTTVTATTAEMLRSGGVGAVAAGNIGTALSDIVGADHDVVVVEASSFQLRFIDAFHPVGAAILNIAPDHLDWHGGFDAYAAAKARIFENQGSGDFVVFDVDDPGAAAAGAMAPSQRVPVSGRLRPPGGNGPAGDVLVVDGHRYPLPELDAAYLLDVTAAASLAGRLGATADGIEAVLRDFVPGEHRRSIVGTWHGVTWVDDSKATNPHAAATAAASYPSVVLIAGGRNKDLDLSPLATVDTVRAVIGIGEAREQLAAVIDRRCYHDATSMEDAVDKAAELAGFGDVVLLAPGCASFDMFSSYAERGDAFASSVRREMGE